MSTQAGLFGGGITVVLVLYEMLTRDGVVKTSAIRNELADWLRLRGTASRSIASQRGHSGYAACGPILTRFFAGSRSRANASDTRRMCHDIIMPRHSWRNSGP